MKASLYPLGFSGEYLECAQGIINRLYTIPRPRWTERLVINPESVGEHSLACLILVQKYFNNPQLDLMVISHDWEKINPATHFHHPHDYPADKLIELKKEKYEIGLETMREICFLLGPRGENILLLWLEFEARITKRAQIAHQIDKLQAIEQAIKYQAAGQSVQAQEFIDRDGPKIVDPSLKRELVRATKLSDLNLSLALVL